MNGLVTDRVQHRGNIDFVHGDGDRLAVGFSAVAHANIKGIGARTLGFGRCPGEDSACRDTGTCGYIPGGAVCQAECQRIAVLVAGSGSKGDQCFLTTAGIGNWIQHGASLISVTVMVRVSS